MMMQILKSARSFFLVLNIFFYLLRCIVGFFVFTNAHIIIKITSTSQTTSQTTSQLFMYSKYHLFLYMYNIYIDPKLSDTFAKLYFICSV